MIDCKVRLLDTRSKVPTYSSVDKSASFNIYCTDACIKDGCVIYHTGLEFEIPKGKVLKIYSDPSISEYSLRLSEGVKLIDSSHIGELLIKFDIKKSIDVDDFNIYEGGDVVAKGIIEDIEKTNFKVVN